MGAARPLGTIAVVTALGLSLTGSAFAADDSTPFISEIHYDNVGTDAGEAIEIQAPAEFDLTGWKVVLYNGNGGAAYNTATLSGAVPAAGVVVQTYPADGIQNGAPDGVALVKPDGTVAEFLTYEGTFTATGGPAAGLAGTDIGVAETTTTPVGYSLQKIGGVWQAPAQNSFGAVNSATTPTDPDPTPIGCTTAVTNTIAEVQGTGTATPLTGAVTVEGIVTADHRTGGFNGIYVQTAGTGGSRPVAAGTASDGIFVFVGTTAANQPAVAIGDKVRVTGTPSEFNGLTELSIGAKTDVQICANNAALPAPVPLTLPLAADARESVEGMLVAPAGAYTVSDTYYANLYGEIVLAAGDKPAHIPTDIARPGTPEALAVKAANANARVLLDDAKTTNLSAAGIAPPYLSAADPVRTGDTVEKFGPVVFSFAYGDWMFEPTTPVSFDTPAASRTSFTATNPRTAHPAAVGGDLKIASFNVLNYFVHFGGDARGAADAAAAAKQQAKIVSAITALDADVVALMEIENSVRFEPDDPQMALKVLVGALNDVDGAGTWDYVRSPAELPAATAQDVITTAIIYKPAKATPKGASRSINDETVWSNAREPIAQTFTAGTIDFTVVANHLKSKSASVAPTGDNVDAGDGQGPYNGDRKRQAASLAAFVASLNTPNAILLGDFNSYTEEDPMKVLYDAGYEDVHTTHAPGKSSYVFGGESGSLDHALVTPTLAKRVTGVDIWNINSVESYAFQYDGYAPFYAPNPYRASDHDPVVIGLKTGLTGPVDLQLLSINDFHGRLEAPSAGVGGAAQLVGLVNQLRTANPNTAWVSAGDNIGASTFISAIDSDNPTLDALNAGGLNVSAVGNHEFDKGLADLTGRVEDRANFPYLAANVYKDGQRILPGYSVQTVGGVKVGYIGVVTEQTGSLVSPDGIQGVEFHDPVAEANTLATQLSDGDASNGEADVVVLLAHEGAATENITSAAALQADPVFGPFTRVNANIDAIISGHTHQPYAFEIPVPGTDRTRPVLQAEDYGVKLGKVGLTYDPATKSVTGSTAELVPVTGAPSDAAVADIVAKAKANADVLGKQKLGSITADIKRAVTSAGAEDRGAESVLGNFIADVQLDQTKAAGRGGAQIAFMNPGGLRADLLYKTDGTVTYADAFAVQPFANDMVTQTLTGAQIKQVLEEQWQPDGASRPVLHLGTSKGLTYSYDVSQARGSRIIASTLKLNGTVLDPAGTYRVSSNSFLAAGGDNFLTLGKGTARITTGDNDLTMLSNYLAANSPVTADPVFRATPGKADSTAPTGTFTVAPTAVWAGQKVTITVTATDDVTPAASITKAVNWGDGTTDALTEHVYTAAGTYTPTVTLTDQAGNSGPATGSATVTVTAQPGSYKLDKTSIWVTQSVSLTVAGISKGVVDWGDGSTVATVANGRYTHKYTKAGSFAVKVTPSNANGPGTPVTAGTVTVKADTIAPVVSLDIPRNPESSASWWVLTGKVSDEGLGGEKVKLKLIEQKSGSWYYYAGGRWTKAASKAQAQDRAQEVGNLLDLWGSWLTIVVGVDKGTLEVTYWAEDKAGNESTPKTYTQKITK
ncbi:ExeM/NucH family extracellular endonuclease [Paractinoplanes durhamensis]|uniref:Multifunctional nuclease/2',3'-cyclic-nucleotide 2'-phosphodiesterase/5'-nucleotidase/3'-nucleotidase n=1 Tax=Paractinoplanes durhamensis TaxID=113563 RepID=A0ABQ3ZBA2_9ACTN|nr:ExeM/NucH family extracellular endonuclease [Actinoplanes durhamensis]GIE07097.1 multifunctional nuclease/2',3'-cyclic-nucleotide 2'-phosphodiesterase/5'-nucleotidase/3'-nucleotidase [Actinoplanes durhamensis]